MLKQHLLAAALLASSVLSTTTTNLDSDLYTSILGPQSTWPILYGTATGGTTPNSSLGTIEIGYGGILTADQVSSLSSLIANQKRSAQPLSPYKRTGLISRDSSSCYGTGSWTSKYSLTRGKDSFCAGVPFSNLAAGTAYYQYKRLYEDEGSWHRFVNQHGRRISVFYQFTNADGRGDYGQCYALMLSAVNSCGTGLCQDNPGGWYRYGNGNEGYIDPNDSVDAD